jgi:F-type H+-transporting ATPase subunit b
VNNPLVQPDPGLFIWTILTFLVLVGLLAKLAWRPLLTALQQREQTIAAAVEDARKTKEELERVRQDSARLLADARRDADGLVARARADAERFREELRQQAQADAGTITKNAERQIQQETARVLALPEVRDKLAAIRDGLTSTVMAETWDGKDGGLGEGTSGGTCAPASRHHAAIRSATVSVERIQASVYC